MEFHEQPDWQRTVGQFVEIRLHGETLRTGTVEAVMPGNSILWMAAEGPATRQMVERAAGHRVFARYSWNAGSNIGGVTAKGRPE